MAQSRLQILYPSLSGLVFSDHIHQVLDLV